MSRSIGIGITILTLTIAIISAFALAAAGADEMPTSTLIQECERLRRRAGRLVEGVNVLAVNNLIEAVSAKAIEAPA